MQSAVPSGPNNVGTNPGNANFLGNQPQAAIMKQMLIEQRAQLQMMEQQKQHFLLREQRQQHILAEQVQYIVFLHILNITSQHWQH